MTGRHWRDENAFSCKDVVTRMYELFDQELSAASDARVHAHLTRCPSCAGELAHQRAFLRCLARRAESERAPETLRVRIIHALRTEIPHGPV